MKSISKISVVSYYFCNNFLCYLIHTLIMDGKLPFHNMHKKLGGHSLTFYFLNTINFKYYFSLTYIH